ncbi:MAG: hypothetical protein J2P50_16920 [Hyphomicrobiaceae bacterium]|nr:hypothetical protein [Hyphomicrobiaceae bacterium]
MTRVIATIALLLGILAALAEISAFLIDRGGIIIGMVRQTDADRPACPPDSNPMVEMLCKDKRNGPIRLDP